ncbi:MAG: hypothetical protein K2H93_03820 [Oscillospiraceae bacterium]|nr:hypothetical protein [Oscillospiraceae bacterium]
MEKEPISVYLSRISTAFYRFLYQKEEDFVDLPEVINMPYYPDDGSIKIINNTVVIKFGLVEEE